MISMVSYCVDVRPPVLCSGAWPCVRGQTRCCVLGSAPLWWERSSHTCWCWNCLLLQYTNCKHKTTWQASDNSSQHITTKGLYIQHLLRVKVFFIKQWIFFCCYNFFFFFFLMKVYLGFPYDRRFRGLPNRREVCDSGVMEDGKLTECPFVFGISRCTGLMHTCRLHTFDPMIDFSLRKHSRVRKKNTA